ncbi:HET-domain-containing protein [Hypoxylon sp. FL0890]|nr:HET-domain-containing protein [Hypoxylon sp. FL0890]
MRLINVQTLELEEFIGNCIPRYAILSHTWGDEEVTFQEWQSPNRPCHKSGYQKVIEACRLTKNDNLKYLWCDTNCIDKTSSAELSEAINSMFSWYRDSSVCYAYLVDVFKGEDFERSRWFTRGWTLQELLAPNAVYFLSSQWILLGSRDEMVGSISRVTGIGSEYLLDRKNLSGVSVAERMSWLARRTTTRPEDMAYCMFGIFNLNLPLLYGEGDKAFLRLQEELIRVSNDRSIFCWSRPKDDFRDCWNGILALSPKAFAHSRYVPPLNSYFSMNKMPYLAQSYPFSLPERKVIRLIRSSRDHPSRLR